MTEMMGNIIIATVEIAFLAFCLGVGGLLVELAEKYPGFGRRFDRVTGTIERFFAFIFGDEYLQYDNDGEER